MGLSGVSSLQTSQRLSTRSRTVFGERIPVLGSFGAVPARTLSSARSSRNQMAKISHGIIQSATMAPRLARRERNRKKRRRHCVQRYGFRGRAKSTQSLT
jgi:hypothetical protein